MYSRYWLNFLFVEFSVEQILEFANHVVSFIQVRGSVPLYWSQTGIKYKPPPRIDRGIVFKQFILYMFIVALINITWYGSNC